MAFKNREKYSYIYSYISYGSIAWGSSDLTKLKKINSEQKHAIIVVNNKDIFSHSQVLLRLDKILDLNNFILNFASLIDRVQSETIPRLFLSKIHKPQHKYSTNYSAKSHLTKKFVLFSWTNKAFWKWWREMFFNSS